MTNNRNVIAVTVHALKKNSLPESTRYVAVSDLEPHDGNIWAGGDTWQACCDDLDAECARHPVLKASMFRVMPIEIVNA